MIRWGWNDSFGILYRAPLKTDSEDSAMNNRKMSLWARVISITIIILLVLSMLATTIGSF